MRGSHVPAMLHDCHVTWLQCCVAWLQCCTHTYSVASKTSMLSMLCDYNDVRLYTDVRLQCCITSMFAYNIVRHQFCKTTMLYDYNDICLKCCATTIMFAYNVCTHQCCVNTIMFACNDVCLKC